MFPVSLKQEIVEQTILYSVQERPQKPISLTVADLEQFLGVSMWMSIVKLPRAQMYWNNTYKVSHVSEVMTVNRFDEIKRFVDFNDNQAQDARTDKLHKVRPLIDGLRERLNQIPKEQCMCVDEQIVPFKGRSEIKQYTVHHTILLDPLAHTLHSGSS